MSLRSSVQCDSASAVGKADVSASFENRSAMQMHAAAERVDARDTETETPFMIEKWKLEVEFVFVGNI